MFFDFFHSLVLFVFWSTIGDVRKCTDEEHITYSVGSKIKDLAQCGCEEKREKGENIKYDKNKNN